MEEEYMKKLLAVKTALDALFCNDVPQKEPEQTKEADCTIVPSRINEEADTSVPQAANEEAVTLVALPGFPRFLRW